MPRNRFRPSLEGVSIEAVVARDVVSSFVKYQAAQTSLIVEDFVVRGYVLNVTPSVSSATD